MLKFRVPTFNFNKEPTIREKILFLVILVASLVIYLDAVWTPRTKMIKVYKAQIVSIKQQTDAVQRLIDATRQQMSRVPDRTEVDVKADPYVKKVLERQVTDVQEEINKTVDLMGSSKMSKKANILKVEIGDRKEESNYIIVPITVDMEGNYSAVKDYFISLENIGRPLIVKSLSIKETEKGKLKANILTELFIAKT